MRIFSHHSENTLRKTLSPVSNLNLGEAVRHLFMISVTVISTGVKLRVEAGRMKSLSISPL